MISSRTETPHPFLPFIGNVDRTYHKVDFLLFLSRGEHKWPNIRLAPISATKFVPQSYFLASIAFIYIRVESRTLVSTERSALVACPARWLAKFFWVHATRRLIAGTSWLRSRMLTSSVVVSWGRQEISWCPEWMTCSSKPARLLSDNQHWLQNSGVGFHPYCPPQAHSHTLLDVGYGTMVDHAPTITSTNFPQNPRSRRHCLNAIFGLLNLLIRGKSLA